MLVAIDGQPVETVASGEGCPEAVAPDGPLSLVVERDQQRVSIVARTGEGPLRRVRRRA